MKLSQITNLTIKIKRPNREINLLFSFVPSNEQFVLAVQSLVFERPFDEDINWMLVEAARRAGVPPFEVIRKIVVKNNKTNKLSEVLIYHDKEFLFQPLTYEVSK